ncbi:MAG: Coq4 family protein [Polyangiaceae bacterium]
MSVAAMDPMAPPPRPLAWGLALRALVGLAKDTRRTDHVFTIISALSGDTFERTYQAFKRTDHGKMLLRERPNLMAVLNDREKLRAMPEGSLGRQYLVFMKDGELTPGGLVEAEEARIDPNADLDLDERRRFVGDRLRDMHDLWHVLTDYGSDDTGEIANLWFSVGQFGSRGMAVIALLGVIDGLSDMRAGWPRFCYRAYRRGRQAKRLVSEPLEEMLELPLDEARRRLGIVPTAKVHPEGMRRGYRRDRQMGAIAR